jgi:hypothetical protein
MMRSLIALWLFLLVAVSAGATPCTKTWATAPATEALLGTDLNACTLGNQLAVGQVDFTTVRTAVNYTPADLSDTGLSLREHIAGIDVELANFLFEASVDTFSEWVSFVGITGTPNGTKFLRDDGSFQTIPGGGDALTSNPLSQFAATTSVQLDGVISDDTGSGALVFATSPTLVTPVLGVATATSVTAGGCVLDATGLACAANSTAGQFWKLFEDSDLGAHFLSIDIAGVNLAASKTLTPDTNGEFDAEELLTDNTVDDGHLDITEEECFPLFTPGSTIASTYDIQSVWRAPVAVTITEVWCETDTGTVNFDFQIDDGTPADVMGTDLVCDASGETDNTSLTGSMAAGNTLDFAITSVASSPTRLTACVVYTR